MKVIFKCKNTDCQKEFVNTHIKARNVKYCSVLCRNRVYYKAKGGAEAQRVYLDRVRGDSRPAPNKIQCLICKKYFRKVGSHITQRHAMTAREYREQFNLEVKRGLLTEYEREPLRDHVLTNGTLKNLKAGQKFWFKKGSKVVGRYKRSPVTMERLKVLYKLNK